MLINSLIRSEAALNAWTLDRDTNRATSINIIQIIQDPNFWVDLKDLKTLLEPIHDVQVQSEDDHAHLGFVLSRWYGIRAHLRSLSNNPSYRLRDRAESIFHPYRKVINNVSILKKPVWQSQFKRQIKPIHHVAYHLDPVNRTEGLDNNTQALIFTFLNHFAVGTNDEKAQMRSHFLAFKNRRAPFLANHYSWDDKDNVMLFWMICKTIPPLLATVAIRIYETAGNSVASERSFSVNKILHTAPRNRTSLDKMDKLQFIYINARVFSYKLKLPRPPTVANPPPPSDPDDQNKRRKITRERVATNDSWLKLDEETELDLEDEYRPKEQDLTEEYETEESEIETEDDGQDKEPKTSGIYSLLQGGGAIS